MKKSIMMSIGIVSLLLGIIGAILPLLPTTPFILLSAYCFSKSSEKFYYYLISMPKFGPIIKNWNEGGTIDRKSKIFCFISIVGILIYFCFYSSLILIAKIILPSTLIPILIYVLTRPEK